MLGQASTQGRISTCALETPESKQGIDLSVFLRGMGSIQSSFMWASYLQIAHSSTTCLLSEKWAADDLDFLSTIAPAKSWVLTSDSCDRKQFYVPGLYIDLQQYRSLSSLISSLTVLVKKNSSLSISVYAETFFVPGIWVTCNRYIIWQ